MMQQQKQKNKNKSAFHPSNETHIDGHSPRVLRTCHRPVIWRTELQPAVFVVDLAQQPCEAFDGWEAQQSLIRARPAMAQDGLASKRMRRKWQTFKKKNKQTKQKSNQ
jgi:hypothetical protein